MNPELQELWSGENLDKDLISFLLEKEVTEAQEGMLLTLWQQLHMESV